MATGKRAELDAMAARGDAIAELVVVAEIIGERFEAADFGEAPLGGGHHGAEHEVEPAPPPSHATSTPGAKSALLPSASRSAANEPSVSPR